MKSCLHLKRSSLKSIILSLFISLLITLSTTNVQAQSKSTYVSKVVLQGFWWDYWNSNYRYNWCSYLTDMAPRLKAVGIDGIWIPPFVKAGSGGDVGYGPFDPYDLGDKYQKGGNDGIRDSTRSGTKDDLLRMIAVMHANGIEVICDAVLNQQSNPGTNTGAGGQDPETGYSMVTASGYKNFRFVSYKTPIIDDSKNDYWTRAGRWPKNYQNFHPNPANNCNSGDICSTFFGPDVDYETPGAIGQSSNIPTSGTVVVGGVTRSYVNPVQSSNYMTNGVRDWMKWVKKQTAVDGFRFDAVKHFPIATQQSIVADVKYNVPTFAQGGQDMFAVGEWVSDAGPIDAYVGNVAMPTGTPTPGEEAVGGFDFAFRGYGAGGGLYSMVKGGGGFDMQTLSNARQFRKWFDYGTKRVYRTCLFVNSHDTYRAIPSKVTNIDSTYDTGNELGGNGQHINYNDTRFAVAYAAANAFSGNPIIYMEDLFDYGTTGKRFSHMPTSTTDLPIRKDIENVIQTHQKLAFKDGDEYLPTFYSGSDASNAGNPAYIKGGSGDHFVVLRKGKAVIGLTDASSPASNNSSDQEVWVSVDSTVWRNIDLYDYSGAHGVTTTHVYGNGRVLIKTAPCGHNIPGARGHGYSVWAPAPNGVTFNTVQDIYDYLATYTPSRNPSTTQEWEMADDLGDSHCLGLGQGGALPTNATNERVAGRVFAKAGTLVSVVVSPEIDGRNLTFTLYDNNGIAVATTSGVATVASPLTVSYTPAADGWLVAKVRNTNNTTAGQKCWVRLTYTAPTVVDTKSTNAQVNADISVWSGNKGTTDVFDCGNWEGGRVPGTASTVIVYGHATPYPILTADLTVNKVNLYTGAQFTVNPGKKLTIISQ